MSDITEQQKGNPAPDAGPSQGMIGLDANFIPGRLLRANNQYLFEKEKLTKIYGQGLFYRS